MEWISVKDRLPDRYKTVLLCCVFMTGKTYWLGSYNKRRMEWEYDYYLPSDFEVTHWMPLPNLPD